MYVIYWGYEDESDAGVVVPPDDAAVCVGDVGGEEGDVVRLPEERHAVERGQQRERNLNSKIWMGFLFTFMCYTKSWINGAIIRVASSLTKGREDRIWCCFDETS